MTPTRPSTLLLILASALACASPLLADELQTGVSSLDISSVAYRAGTAANKRAGKRLKDALGSQLVGATETRRVTFDFEDELGQTEFPVRGVLLGWKNLRVESYLLANAGEAVLFTNQDREDEGAQRLIEMRGRSVLVISGKAMSDTALVAKARGLAWPSNAPKRVDALGLQEGSDDLYFYFSDQALAASPILASRIAEQDGSLEMIAKLDPAAVFSVSGGTKRLETGGSIVTASSNAIALYGSPATEQSYAAFLGALGHGAAVPASGGLSGALDGATGSSLPAKLGASNDGQTFNVKIGDEIKIELAGNPTTGYRWRQDGPLTGLTEVDSDFQGAGAGGPVGSGGTFSFVFRASAKGNQTLSLVYSRASGAPAKTFSVTIVVK